MCGGGLTWTYKPTPQPGDYVEALICGKCYGRAKLPRLVSTQVYETVEYLAVAVQEVRGSGVKYTRTQTQFLKSKTTKPAAPKCCGPADIIKTTGKVVRSVWSKDKRFKQVKNFFVIVKIPTLKRQHWATIDTVTLINPLDHLISSVERVPPG